MGDNKRFHDMPFGAQVLENGGVRFGLWAPSAQQVELCLEQESARKLPMKAQPDGWFHCETDDAGPGSHYRFNIDGQTVPDPASRFQPDDVHQASEVIDPSAWTWTDGDWHGRPWEEAVVYELHVGTFSPQGTFSGVREKLDYLKDLGVTAIELMPVADFPGARNWGYDGTYLFAPDSRYGRPEDLKVLVNAAHELGLMVFLDVVYNHFGPEGNYLHGFAPEFFTERHHTPWGAAINFDGKHSKWVREFYIENALYWLEEYRFDGLRLDAVHAILDDSTPDILEELASRVRQKLGGGRHIHLVLENDSNQARYLKTHGSSKGYYDAQWNDDIHHAMHTVLTGEEGGYYRDYADDPVRHLIRCLAEGFAYQGEPSVYRDREKRGEPSAHLSPSAFVAFMQNHDQVGNRAFGERIGMLCPPERLHAMTAIMLLAPSPPLLFMGQEWNSNQPFLFFCDFGPDLADKVVAGRREEFSRFPEFRDPQTRERIPNPMDIQTFESSRLDWNQLNQPEYHDWLRFHRELLALRRDQLAPRLSAGPARLQQCERLTAKTFILEWTLADNSELVLLANLADDALPVSELPPQPLLYCTHEPDQLRRQLPSWSVAWHLRTEHLQTEHSQSNT